MKREDSLDVRHRPYVVVQKRKPRGGPTGARAIVVLSNASVPLGSPSGTVVGNLSVLSGFGTYSFSIVHDPSGQFAISGNQLVTVGGITGGVFPVTIGADNGLGSSPTNDFDISVVGALAGQSMGLLLALTYSV